MPDYTDIADRYISAWNETDPATRGQLIKELWADDARYIDPLVVADGRGAIDGTIFAVQGQFPGFVFRLAGPVDGHHDQLRFTWELGPAGADAPVAGFDVAVLNEDGRIQTVFGFLDRVPAG
jgi:hypothetical protein